MAEATIEDYLDMMDDILERAKPMPMFPGKYLTDVNQLKAYIDDIRFSMPAEIRQAKTLVQDRASVLATAKKEADEIVRKAEVRAAALVDNHEITKKAEQRAAEIEKQSAAKLKAVRNATNDYLMDVMSKTEEALSGSLSQVRKMKSALKDVPQRPVQPPQNNR